ncbi:MAG: AAA family ATPase [Gemmataceae bacterium]|nr:AAA family ATPase [Gemmataceae bacterium]MCI0742096.1 AAA family ATPase [Gemmataceae bacterium]
MLTRFSVKNYKCLKDVSLALTPIHVLIGQNDSGKSSLLEAMYALFKASEPGRRMVDGFPFPWKGKELLWLLSTDPFVELEAESDTKVNYRIRIGFEPSGRIVHALGEWSHGTDLHQLVRRQGTQYSAVSISSADQPIINQLVDEFAGVGAFRFNSRNMAMPSALEVSDGFFLEEDGFGLPLLLDRLKDYDVALFSELQESFRDYFPQFLSIRLETVNAYRREKTGEETHQYHFGPPGKEIQLVTERGRIRLQQASDGVILFLGFLALCHIPRPPKLFLVEEPENGIYPKRLKEVVQLLKSYVSENHNAPQIVMTTHSPYLMGEFKPEEITFLSRQPDGGVRARPLSESRIVQERLGKEFEYLDEIWYNYDEEVLFGDAPVPAGH